MFWACDAQAASAMTSMQPTTAAKALAAMEPYASAHTLDAMSKEAVASILMQVGPGTAAAAVNHMSSELAAQVRASGRTSERAG